MGMYVIFKKTKDRGGRVVDFAGRWEDESSTKGAKGCKSQRDRGPLSMQRQEAIEATEHESDSK